MRTGLSIYYLLIPIFMVSCASERKITYEKAEARGLDKYMSDVRYVTDEEGNVRPDSDKRSQFDSRGTYAGAKGYSGEDYSKKNYRSKRWGNNKDFNAKNFSGNKNGSRFQHSPHFVQQQANAQGQNAAAGGENYATSGYAGNTGAANRGNAVVRPSDAKSASKSNYPAPPVYSLDQANGIGVSDTNSMMGR
ncbi:hypothetical protein [Rubritalea profundi]|uniref:Lipoprotein n=1 Tax=Rubritalea profundi TaxID=1658618 RepID=A0A2S7TYW1_9BACT|nr:hypothetical protein [Rubritalea profundi]PQJ27304.1 hypothetical protein BSZ32_01540 [Rubritalea profundi]